MSILIKKMEMPKACWECPLKVHLFQQLWCVPNNKVINREDNTEREPDCPLIEVQPHGRLIDADALIAKTRKLYCDNCILRTGTKNGKKQFVYEIGDAPCRGCWIDDMVTELQDAPTIIEAEGSKE